MYDAQVAFDSTLLNQIQSFARDFPDEVKAIAKTDIVPWVRHEVDKTLRIEPPVRRYPGDYPLEWTSAKQAYYVKNFVLKHDADGHIIPYTRSHALVKAWHVLANYSQGLTNVRVFNDSPVAQYVYGQRQQRFHRITGWPNAADELQRISLGVDERLMAAAARFVDRFGRIA